MSDNYNLLKINDEKLNSLLNKHNINFYESFQKYVDIIYDIFINKNIIETNDSNILTIIALYYCYIEKDYDEMKKYFQIAIKLNNSHAMNYFANYYRRIENDYVKMKKYYLMSIQLDNFISAGDLAHYYQYIEKDYEQMKKYYKIAINLGCKHSILNLAHYYKEIEKNYDEMKKYYLIGINLGDTSAMFYLGLYYEYEVKNYKQMKKYYKMAINLGDTKSMHTLGGYYEFIKDYEKMKKYYKMSIQFGDTSTHILDLVLYYLTIENNNNKAISYIQMINKIDKNDDLFIDKFVAELTIYDKIIFLNFYIQLINIESKTKELLTIISRFESVKEINVYKNKLAYSIKNNIKDDCAICLEKDKLVLLFDCMHTVCADCYPTYSNCTICKTTNILLS